MTNAEKLQAVKNTLGIMQIPTSESNVDRLYGIYKVLTEVQNDLSNKEPQIELEAVEEEEGNG